MNDSVYKTTVHRNIAGAWCIAFLLALSGIFSIFSCGNEVPSFDGEHAFTYLTAQTGLGPRNPGSEGHEKCLAYLAAELSKTADLLNMQRFEFTDELIDSTYELTNIIASFNVSPPNNRRILLTAHWDTRPFADKDPEPANRLTPIPGANDGASGVAVLLEIAAVLKQNPPPIGVDVVLFDGEDYGKTEVNDLEHFFLGSKHFTKTMGAYKPEFAILLDMVGSKSAQFHIEGFSFEYAPMYVRRIWETAQDLGFSSFVNHTGPRINDDHLILNRAGIPAVDIIDISHTGINYPYWHTLSDTPDQCSPETLAQIGTLLLNIIYN